MGSLLNDVNILIAKKVGDLSRLEHIKETIENNKQLYDSDRAYVDELSEKHISSNDKTNDAPKVEQSATIKEEPSDGKKQESLSETPSNTFCGSCGKSIGNEHEYCPKCGAALKGQSNSTPNPNTQFQRPVEWKSESTTLLLSILLGLFGIQGVGHLYVGKIGKGVGILIGSIILIIVAIALTATGIGAIIGIPLIIMYIVMFIWQIIDSRNICREYNRYLEQYHKPPNW